LKVSNLKGLLAWGCDILSFSTEAMRIDFEINQDVNNVLRFIEVKGRVSEKGSISLKGNELEKAKIFDSRYYLYRIYEDINSRGTFELIEFPDPLNAEREAIRIAYDVNPFHSHRSSYWEIREIAN